MGTLKSDGHTEKLNPPDVVTFHDVVTPTESGSASPKTTRRHCIRQRPSCYPSVRTPANNCRTTLVLLLAVSVTATEISLSPDTGGGLARAVETAAAGDTIILGAGRYMGPDNRNIVLSKPLHFESATGETAETTIIDCEHASQCLTVTKEASGSSIRKISFQNGGRRVPGRLTKLPRAAAGLVAASRVSVPGQSNDTSADDSESSHVGDSATVLGRELSKISKKAASAALLHWLRLSGAEAVVSALPQELMSDRLLRVRVGAVESTPDPGLPDKADSKPEIQTPKSGRVPPNASPEQPRDEVACAPAPAESIGGCNGSMTLVDQCGSLTEGSDGMYSNDAVCSWTIDPLGARSLFISFSMLDIEEDDRCEYDALSLWETARVGQRYLGKICGSFSSPVFCEASGICASSVVEWQLPSPLTIRFSSDSSGRQEGFALSWRSSSETPPTLPVPGGCILVRNAAVELDAVHIQGGLAEHGGGLALVDAAASIRRSQITGNSARFGGALFSSGSLLWIDDSLFTHNNVESSDCEISMDADVTVVAGGAGLFLQTSSVLAEGSELSGNSVQTQCERASVGGGGLLAIDSEVKMEGSRVVGNIITTTAATSPNAYGGALHITRGSLSLTSTNLTGNALSCENNGTCEGGGLHAFSTNVSLVACNVSGNSLDKAQFSRGGGIFSWMGPLSITSSVVSANVLSCWWKCDGGGIYFDGVDSLVVQSCDVNTNVLRGDELRGGGIFSYSSISLSLSRVTNNSLIGSQYCAGGGCSTGSNVSVWNSQVSRNALFCASAQIGYGAGWFYFFEDETSALGVSVQSSVFEGNYANATDVKGGAMCFFAQISRVTIELGDLLASSNSIFGSQTIGGAIRVESTAPSAVRCMMNSIQLRYNSCHGNSRATGGALSFRNIFRVWLQSASIADNSAASGGALHFEEAGFAFLAGVLQGNHAIGVGGAILVSGGVKLQLQNLRLQENRALLADNLFGFGAGFQVDTRHNVTMISDGGISVVVQGRDLVLSKNSLIRSIHTGWEIAVSSSNSSEVIRFLRCSAAQYLLTESNTRNPNRCRPCPTGAQCNGANEVLARRSHWGVVELSSGLLTMFWCPPGYCCEKATCSPFDYCPDHRSGDLCGRCKDGFSEVLGGSGCRPDSECVHFKWIVPCVLVLTGLCSIGLIFFRHRIARQWTYDSPNPETQPDLGEIEVTVFFFQILPLVMSFETQQGSVEFVEVLFSVFSLRLSGGTSAGIGPYKGFSAVAKIASGALIPLLCCFWVLLCIGLHSILSRLQRTEISQHRARFAGILGALFDVLLLGYSSLVKTTFLLLGCVSFQGRPVLLFSAHIECYTGWQIAVFCLGMPFLVGFPILLAYLVRLEARHRTHRALGCSSIWLRTVVAVIADPFDNKRPSTHQWAAVLMVERLVMTVISVFVTQPVWRAWGLVALPSLMLAIQMLVRPFKRRSCNGFMAAALLLIVLIGAWEVAAAVYAAAALEIPSSMLSGFSKLSTTLISGLLLYGVGKLLSAPVGAFWNRRVGGKSEMSPSSNVELVGPAPVQGASHDAAEEFHQGTGSSTWVFC